MRAPATVAVLAYHSIDTAPTRSFASLTVDPGLFDEHLAGLREAGLEAIPFCEVPATLAVS